MNKYEKEVQKSLLESEAEAIEEIRKQYEEALKEIQDKIQQFDDQIQELDNILSLGYDSNNPEAEAEYKNILSIRQSKIYQKQYQEALEGQISGIIDNLHNQSYSTIDQYLKDSYQDAYVGTMYDLTQQGIPVIAPIDQAAVMKAVLTDSKISEGLYEHLGVDYADLKKRITQEISRGIATSMAYSDIARNLSNSAKAPLSRTLNIVRTEGHRIQQASIADAQQKAKDKGADVVKQWDSTLDGRTRPDHRLLDGQIRELDEDFEVNGKKAERPGYFGIASEDCNCRCTCLTRARWALDGSFTKMDNFSKQIVQFESPKDYEDFKKKFWSKENLQYMDYVDSLEKKYGTNSLDEIIEKMTSIEFDKYYKLENNNPFIAPFKESSKYDNDTTVISPFINTSEFEDLYFINSTNNKILKQVGYEKKRHVYPTPKMRKMVENSDPYTIISIHNHPGSLVPSIDDINSAFKHKITCKIWI